MTDTRYDNIQHGIDNDPYHDTEKGAALGGAGGALTGAMAGAMMGPAGAAIGAAVGGVIGAVASGVAVNALDRVDDDDTMTGLHPDGYTQDGHAREDYAEDMQHTPRGGIQTGGYDLDGSPDTRGISEKAADAVTGDRIDNRTGKTVI